MNILVVIPARGGSKRLLLKNRKVLAGKPLIAHSILTVQRSKYRKYFDFVCSTDDKQIAKIAQAYDCRTPFVRPKQISTDKALSIDVVTHALRYMERQEAKEYSFVIFLQPTSPLRTKKQLDEAIDIALKRKCDSVVSVVEVDHRLRNMRLSGNSQYLECLSGSNGNGNSKNAKDLLAINGAIYITRRDVIVNQKSFYGKKSLPYVMDKDSSIDIDTISDFKKAESVINKQKRRKN